MPPASYWERPRRGLPEQFFQTPWYVNRPQGFIDSQYVDVLGEDLLYPVSPLITEWTARRHLVVFVLLLQELNQSGVTSASDKLM